MKQQLAKNICSIKLCSCTLHTAHTLLALLYINQHFFLFNSITWQSLHPSIVGRLQDVNVITKPAGVFYLGILCLLCCHTYILSSYVGGYLTCDSIG